MTKGDQAVGVGSPDFRPTAVGAVGEDRDVGPNPRYGVIDRDPVGDSGRVIRRGDDRATLRDALQAGNVEIDRK